MATRRMAVQRGQPVKIYSDNGTNLRGADSKLQLVIKELTPEMIEKAKYYQKVWKFILPGHHAWGGGGGGQMGTAGTKRKKGFESHFRLQDTTAYPAYTLSRSQAHSILSTTDTSPPLLTIQML